MAYLLDVLLPGLGHLGLGRLGSGLALVLAWAFGTVLAVVAASFDLRAAAALPAVHLLLAAVACLHVRRLRARGARGPRPLAAAGLVALAPLLVGALLLGCATFLARPVVIRSGSMEPGIWTGDTILVQVFWPQVGRIALGDVVLVLHPTERNRLLLKRVVGTAGDLIEVRGGEIHRNGRALSECALRELRDPESGQRVVERVEVLDGRPYLVWDQPATVSQAMRRRVPRGHVFVLGDNRDRSGDSRSFGTVPVERVRARVRVGLAPPESRVDQAPRSARRAAFAQCGSRGPRRTLPPRSR